MAASATFALKAGVWFRRGRLLMVSPDSRGTACPPSGRNSTYRPVQISGTGSGIVVIGYELSDFVKLFEQLDIKDLGLVSLVGRDRIIRMRSAGGKLSYGAVLSADINVFKK